MAVRAVRTALLQPANPAAANTTPAPISERRESIIRVSADRATQPSRLRLRGLGSYPGRTPAEKDRPRHWGGIVFTRIVQTSHDFPFCRCGAARVLA